MPIVDTEFWVKQVTANTDDYGGAVIKVARRVMELLDEEPGDFNCHEIICRADDEAGADGITGFMAGAAASIISRCHSRGEEFRRKWNEDVSPRQAEEVNAKEGAVLNPAILNYRKRR